MNVSVKEQMWTCDELVSGQPRREMIPVPCMCKEISTLDPLHKIDQVNKIRIGN